MLDLEENLRELNNLDEKLIKLKETVNLKELQEELENLKEESMTESFWQDSKKSSVVYSKIKVIEKKIKNFENIEKNIVELKELNELLAEEQDETLEKELEKNTIELSKSIDKLQVDTLFSGKYDGNNAILTLHPGAGGTESQDWAEMLYRMYTRWANANGFNVKELDYLEGEEAGLKSVTFLIVGENAYGYLKGEMGVHRLVRISPFDSGGRRHTSFASLEVLPEIKDDVEININPDDLRIDTYRASGAGGQHINKTDSAVRITHIPTNIVVSCQSERSQQMNKETAMTMLKSKLINLKEQENKQTIDELKGVQKDIAWGSQIRSYVFCPYTMVKDHRTNYEVGNVQAVMDGDLNEFMIEYLKMIHKNSNN